MRAKYLKYFWMVAVGLGMSLLLSACATKNLRRFAPPGIIKYEDLAKGEAIDPAIASRAKQVREKKDKSFPKLSEQASVAPKGINAPTRAKMKENLESERQLAASGIEEARSAAALERQQSITDQRERAEQAIEEGAQAIARENRGPIPKAD